MFPALWPNQSGWRVANLYHVSAPFYVRTTEPTDQDKFPPVKIGRTQNLYWDQDGKQAYSENQGRIHGDVSVVGGRLRVFILDYDIGIQDREYSISTKAVYKGAVVSWGGSNRIFVNGHAATRAAVSDDAGNNRVYFIRRSDKNVTFFNWDSMADPAGYRTWQYHSNAIGLTYNAANGPQAYQRSIATAHRVYAAGCGGSGVPDRMKIVGFTGLKSGESGASSDEVPKWIDITGPEVVGTTVVNKAVGHLGVNTVVFQQAAIEQLENPNPASGYSQPYDDYCIVGYNTDKTPIYGQVPYNSFANWSGSSTIRYLWSARCYRVDVTDAADKDGKVTTTATRTLIGQCLNEWRLKDYTGRDPFTNKDWIVYTREYVYDQPTGQYKYVYTPKVVNGQQVVVAPQYIPAVKSQINGDKREEIGNSGGVLCAVMLTRDGPYIKMAPWNASAALQETDGNGSLSYIPAGLTEVNPSFWLGVSRYTVGSNGPSRWMYSRNKGSTWTLIATQFTNTGTYYCGATNARKDLNVASKTILTALKAAESTL